MPCSSLLLPPLPDVPPFVAGNPTRHLYSCDNSTSGLSHIPGFPKPRTFPASHHAPPASTLLSQTLTQGRHVPAGGCRRKGALGPGVPSVPGARSPRNCCTGRPCPASPKVFSGCFGLVSLLQHQHSSGLDRNAHVTTSLLWGHLGQAVSLDSRSHPPLRQPPL